MKTALPKEESRPITTPFTVDSVIVRWGVELDEEVNVERWLERKA